MTPDWSPLRHSLAACRRDATDLAFWWRDDDAIEPTPALDRLTRLCVRTGVPVHLAIIPAHADARLASHIDPQHLIPVVHGWAHTDHSTGAHKKNEFLTPRAEAARETQQALTRMTSLFGAPLRTMFVPPWNRIDGQVIAALPAQGYTALSTFLPRRTATAAPGLRQINTHIDPIDWKNTRDLIDPDRLIAHTAALLEARRTGQADTGEPLGLLTHHLVHTDAIWTFSAHIINELLDGGATPWTMQHTA